MLSSSQHAGLGSGSGSEPKWTLWSCVRLRAGLLILIVFFIARGGLRGHPLRARNIGIRLKVKLHQNMFRRGQNLRGPYSYVITGPNPQFYRKVPITINPVHRLRASPFSWRPERDSRKLAVGASGTHRTPTTNKATIVASYDSW